MAFLPVFRHRLLLCLSLVFLGTLALRLFHLSFRGLWTDEFITLASIRLPLRELFIERLGNAHFPTYFIGLKGWTALFGDREWALRLPSALFSSLTAPVIFLLALRHWGWRAALLAALFFALHQRMIWAGQEARPYAVAFFCAALSLWALLDAFASGRSSRWVLWSLVSLIGLALHGTYAFAFLAQLMGAIHHQWRIRRGRHDFFIALAVTLIGAAGLMALMAHFQSNDQFDEARSLPELKLFADVLVHLFFGQFGLVAGSWFKYLTLILIGWVFWRTGRWAATKNHPDATDQRAHPLPPLMPFALLWAVVPSLGLLIVSLVSSDQFSSTRYHMIGAGGAVLLMAAALDSIARPRLRNALIAGVVLLQAIVSVGFYYSHHEQVREAFHTIAPLHQPGEPILMCEAGRSDLMAEYYDLGAYPIPFNPRIEEDEALEALLGEKIGQAPGFWLVIYDMEGKPQLNAARRWARDQGYDKVHEATFEEIKFVHYRAAAE